MAFATKERVRVDTFVDGVALHMSVEEARILFEVADALEGAERRQANPTIYGVLDALGDVLEEVGF